MCLIPNPVGVEAGDALVVCPPPPVFVPKKPLNCTILYQKSPLPHFFYLKTPKLAPIELNQLNSYPKNPRPFSYPPPPPPKSVS